MKKKIKDCTFREFIKNKSDTPELIYDMYPLLEILRYYNKSAYSEHFKEEQWRWLKRQLKTELLETEVDIEEKEYEKL